MMKTVDFSITSAIPVWLGDRAVECHVLLEPGPASFIWEAADGNCKYVETDKDVLWTKLGLDSIASSQTKNPNVTESNEPMDVSYSLEDLQQAEGIDMSDIIQVDYNKDNESWMDMTSTSLCDEDDIANSYECDVCSKTFDIYSKLKRHKEKIHGGRKKFKSKVIQQKMLSKKARQHQRLLNVLKCERKVLTPLGQNGVRCYLCLKNYSSKETVDKHLATFHKVDPNKPPPTIACQVCKAACASKAHLALHMLQVHSHNKDERKTFVMPTFSFDFLVEKPDNPVQRANPVKPANSVKPANPVKPANSVKPANIVKPASPVKSDNSAATTVADCLTPHPCCLCDKILYSRLHLETHTRVHTQEKPLGKKEGFPCEDQACASSPGFKTNEQLLVHVESCHAFGCSEPGCSQHFASKHLLANHISLAHGIQLIQDCEDENQSQKITKPLGPVMTAFIAKVFKNRTSAEGVSCLYCRSNHIFTTSEALTSHYLDNHPYKCPKGCDKLWKYRSSVRKHYKTHHSESGNAISCEHCLDIFAFRADFERHQATAHHDQASTPVIMKKKSYLQSTPKTEPKKPERKEPKLEQGIKNENIANSSDSEKVFQCPDCDKFYHHPDSIRKHCRKVHKVLVLNCRHCFIVFLSAEDKAKHKNLVHGQTTATSPNSSPVKSNHTSPKAAPEQQSRSPAKPVYIIPSILKKSLSISDKPAKATLTNPETLMSEQYDSAYQCPRCERSYTLGKSLRKHCRFAHQQLSICFCKYCTKVFTSQEDKESHMTQYHTDELGFGDLLGKSQDELEASILESSLLETDLGQELVEFVNNGGTSVTENENSVTNSNQPSSPEEFHGFITPTKEMDKI